MARTTRDFPVQAIVPDGRENAVGTRWWRDFHADVLGTIGTALAGLATANQGVADAAAASGAAGAAQATADAATAGVGAVSATLADHAGSLATPGQAAHIRQGLAPVAFPAPAPGLAPVAYDQTFTQSQRDRAEAVAVRLDDLVAKLQAAGVLQ